MESGRNPSSSTATSTSTSHVPHHHHHHHHHYRPLYCPLFQRPLYGPPCPFHHHHHPPPFVCPMFHHHLSPPPFSCPPPFPDNSQPGSLAPTFQEAEPAGSGCGLDDQTVELHGVGGEEEEEPVFVMTDEWMEFFAKSEAKRRLDKQKRKQKKANK